MGKKKKYISKKKKKQISKSLQFSKKVKMEDSITRHHIYPQSRRSGDQYHILLVEWSYHSAYHHLFANLNPNEVKQYLDEVWFKAGKFIPPLIWLKQHKTLNK